MGAIDEAATHVAVKATAVATYTGAGSAVLFGLNANEFAALGGLVVAVCGLILSAYYKHQHLQLARNKRSTDSDASDAA